MKYNILKSTKIVLLVLIILFSLFLLYSLIGIYLNGMINITYEVFSIEDLKYVLFYSKLLIIYIIIITPIMIYNLLTQYRKKDK